MNIAYLHIVFNHLPIMGVPVALGVLLLGLWTRNDAVVRAAQLAFVVLGAATVVVALAGLGAEDWAEHVARFSEQAIDAHRAMAFLALGTTLVLAVAAGVVFFANGGVGALRREGAMHARPLPRGATTTVLVLAVIASAVLGYAGKLGGRIRHTEFLGADAAAAAAAEPAGETEDND
jgi:hypothetical protein